jgi:hypothetical protein
MKSFIKAGFICTTIAILFTILDEFLYFPPYGELSRMTYLVVYFATGVLSAMWLSPPRTLSDGGIAGIKSGLIVGILDGVAKIVISDIIYMLDQYAYVLSVPIDSVFYLLARIFGELKWACLAVILAGLGGVSYILIGKLARQQ